MTKEQKKAEFERLVKEIQEAKSKWVYLDLKIRTKTFNSDEDQIKIESEWNSLDAKLVELFKELRKLQTEYYVEFFDDRNFLTTALVILNIDVAIDTKQNGWNSEMIKPNVGELIFEIHNHLSRTSTNPQIFNIVKK